MSHRTVLRSAFAFVVTLLVSATAHAQLFRAYLAPSGSDANPCTLPAPCRLLPAALAAVASGGEIWMLDSANYNTGTVNITKSVTILAVPGALGSVVAAGGNAIVIATAGVKVALRNLVIVPFPGGAVTNGIVMTAGAGLTVENCLIANLSQSGIVVSTAASVRVTDTTIRDNGGDGLLLQDGARATVTRATISGNGNYGVVVFGTAASTTTTADIADSTMDGNSDGVFASSQNASGVVKVSVRDSRLVRNPNFGVAAQSTAGAAVTLSVSNNIISNNGAGIAAVSAGSKVWASGNTVSDNGTGLVNASGLFESACNNAVRNNTSANTTGTITGVPVACSANTFSVGGTLSGLGPSRSVVLQNNSTDNLTLSANGGFTFATPIADGSPYAVTVLTPPSAQTCLIGNASGTVSGANVTNVTVSCVGDLDGDGYFSPGQDCDDTDSRAHPGQTSFFSAQRLSGGFDYNCTGIEERQLPNIGSCALVNGVCARTPGWIAAIPACGLSGTWIIACSASCQAEISSSVQACH